MDPNSFNTSEEEESYIAFVNFLQVQFIIMICLVISLYVILKYQRDRHENNTLDKMSEIKEMEKFKLNDSLTIKLAATSFQAFTVSNVALKAFSGATECIKTINKSSGANRFNYRRRRLTAGLAELNDSYNDSLVECKDKVKEALTMGERAKEYLRRLRKIIYEAKQRKETHCNSELITAEIKLIAFERDLSTAKSKMESHCHKSDPKLISVYESLAADFNRLSDFHIDGIKTLPRRHSWTLEF